MAVKSDFDEIIRVNYEGGGDFPPVEKEYDPRGRGRVPSWAGHTMTFLLGFIVSNLLIWMPLAAAIVMLVALCVYVTIAATRRWA